jgi:hypothetical protein
MGIRSDYEGVTKIDKCVVRMVAAGRMFYHKARRRENRSIGNRGDIRQPFCVIKVMIPSVFSQLCSLPNTVATILTSPSSILSHALQPL